MNYLKISTRLVLGFAVMGALMALLGAIAFAKLNVLGEEFSSVVQDRYVKVSHLTSIAETNARNMSAIRDLLLQDDEAKKSALLSELAANSKSINADFQALEQTVVSPEGKDMLAKAQAARAAYAKMRDKVVGLAKAGDKDAGAAALYADLAPAQRTYQAEVAAFSSFQEKLMAKASESVNNTLQTSKTVIVGLVSFALLVAAIIGTWITRSTTRPIARAVDVARAVAAGDLSMQIDTSGHNETAQLFQAMAEMQTQLSSIVEGVRQSAHQVVTASSEIAQGNNDLSSRTEQQASALEETAASMEELSSTVKHNADNARQANQLAVSASTVAVHGGEVVGQVVDTMKGINDSSKKIADIISVIDGIAFQTNILALNAAVEAARAGEQGRGFAVVASEVRSLAQLSAAAAKEIKVLIANSVSQVDQGTSLVAKAGDTMTEVVSAIRRVADIIGEVSAASNEQSLGVTQVNEAVAQMDQVTQQNAALVEESAAAADSLSKQAEDLLQSVAVFTINGNATKLAYAAPQPARKLEHAEHGTPNRAPNVVLPALNRAKPTAPKTKRVSTAVANTGNDDWASF
ncbi:MAG: methyl-accepting chemotaxis protein [Burkholderiales bacterium]|nr:methyl-accepting chemotaxis protein [Burkholderiales bacterium]